MSNEKYYKFIEYCNQNRNIRTVILTSSRARSLQGTDQFSDYDLELYVLDLSPFFHDDDWIEQFGTILVKWPLSPQSTWSEEWITRLIQFSDGVRFDFQITTKEPRAHSNFDAGYRVIVDKDQKTSDLAEAKYENYFVTRPTKEQFEEKLNSFYWNILYVAKNLWRNELFYAKYMMDNVLRFSCLQHFIEWHIGLKEDWEVSTGKCGRWFRNFLDEKLWKEIELTFSDADISHNWESLEAMLNVVKEICVPLAASLNYAFPFNLEKGIWEFVERIKQTPREND